MVNSLVFQGRLTADVELKKTQSGISHAEFTIAWSEKYKEIETKCFLRCKAWRQTAEFISKYFAKGAQILIEGRMVTEEWENENGKQSRILCEVEKVHFCGGKSESTQSTTGGGASTEPMPNVEVVSDDDLPF